MTSEPKPIRIYRDLDTDEMYVNLSDILDLIETSKNNVIDITDQEDVSDKALDYVCIGMDNIFNLLKGIFPDDYQCEPKCPKW